MMKRPSSGFPEMGASIIKMGGTCLGKHQCSSNFCFNNQCSLPKDAGDTCSPALNNCPWPLMCSSYSHVCIDKEHTVNGDQCASQGDCKYTHFCNGSLKRCEKLAYLYQKCASEEASCSPGLTCAMNANAGVEICQKSCFTMEDCNVEESCIKLDLEAANTIGHCERNLGYRPDLPVRKPNHDNTVYMTIIFCLFIIAWVLRYFSLYNSSSHDVNVFMHRSSVRTATRRRSRSALMEGQSGEMVEGSNDGIADPPHYHPQPLPVYVPAPPAYSSGAEQQQLQDPPLADNEPPATESVVFEMTRPAALPAECPPSYQEAVILPNSHDSSNSSLGDSVGTG